MKPDVLAKHLVGGLTVGEMERWASTWPNSGSLAGRGGSATIRATLSSPRAEPLFQRDPSCWIYNGVTVNPMYWPARRREALNMLTIYRYHPMFQDADFEFWYPEQSADGSFNIQDFGRASMEGGDVSRSATARWRSA